MICDILAYMNEKSTSGNEKHITGFSRDLCDEDDFVEDLVEKVFTKDNVFLEAYPVVAPGKKVFAGEYITKHGDPLKNPVPISMLKVRAGIEYRFMFKLDDYVYEKANVNISAKGLGELFREILLLGGIGAKTNVGFGQLEDKEKTDGKEGICS
jgi:CRISPR-associated protein Cmr6